MNSEKSLSKDCGMYEFILKNDIMPCTALTFQIANEILPHTLLYFLCEITGRSYTYIRRIRLLLAH